MNRASLVHCALVVVLPALAWANPEAKHPVPPATARQSARTLIHELYEGELADARSAKQKLALARKLIEVARRTEDLAHRYMLLLEANELAVKGEDGHTAFEAIDEIEKAFSIDAVRLKGSTLFRFTKLARTKEEHKDIAEQSLVLVQEALRKDDFDTAGSLAKMGLDEARKAGLADLQRQCEQRVDQMQRAGQQYSAVKKAKQTLEIRPDDRPANQIVGEYLCLVKGDWKSGLPYLALGDDKRLADAAAKDIKGTLDATAQVAMGDRWWDLASAREGPAKVLLQRRAERWYREAAGRVVGLAQRKVQQRLQEAASLDAGQSPPSIRPGADGPIVIRWRHEVDSVKTSLLKAAEKGTTMLPVSNTAGFKAEDEILIITMQGRAAGVYEFQRVKSSEAGSLRLMQGLANDYQPDDKVTVQRVPNFTDVTVEPGGQLTASPWNGATGGIVAFRAHGVVHVKQGASIHANALGYRGGQGVAGGGHANGYQGESYLGLGSQGNRNANAGGGGAGNYASNSHPGFADWGCGGGGGSYGTGGSNGIGKKGFGLPGVTYGNRRLSLLLLGSGGGSGAYDDDGGGRSSGGAGGAGGGIVCFTAKSIVLSGTLSAYGGNGSNAGNRAGEDESSGGGGGSGGSVLLVCEKEPPTVKVDAVVRGGVGGGGAARGGNGGRGFYRTSQLRAN